MNVNSERTSGENQNPVKTAESIVSSCLKCTYVSKVVGFFLNKKQQKYLNEVSRFLHDGGLHRKLLKACTVKVGSHSSDSSIKVSRKVLSKIEKLQVSASTLPLRLEQSSG